MPIECQVAAWWILIAAVGGTIGLWTDAVEAFFVEMGGLDETIATFKEMMMAALAVQFKREKQMTDAERDGAGGIE